MAAKYENRNEQCFYFVVAKRMICLMSFVDPANDTIFATESRNPDFDFQVIFGMAISDRCDGYRIVRQAWFLFICAGNESDHGLHTFPENSYINFENLSAENVCKLILFIIASAHQRTIFQEYIERSVELNTLHCNFDLAIPKLTFCSKSLHIS